MFVFVASIGTSVSAAGLDGKKLFETKCASCHGKDAKGNPGMVKGLKLAAADLDLVDAVTAAKTDADLVKITTDGVRKMPAFKGKLKAEEIAAVVAYLRSMMKPAETAVPTAPTGTK